MYGYQSISGELIFGYLHLTRSPTDFAEGYRAIEQRQSTFPAVAPPDRRCDERMVQIAANRARVTVTFDENDLPIRDAMAFAERKDVIQRLTSFELFPHHLAVVEDHDFTGPTTLFHRQSRAASDPASNPLLNPGCDW